MNDEVAVDAAVTQYLEELDQTAPLREEQTETFCDRIKSYAMLPFRLLSYCIDYIRNSLGLLPLEPHQLWGLIQNNTSIIRQIQENEDYEASAVYITFETERAQRAAMEALDAGRLEVWTNTRIHLEKYALFRGEYVQPIVVIVDAYPILVTLCTSFYVVFQPYPFAIVFLTLTSKETPF